MDIREQIRAALTKKAETAAVVKPSATFKDSAAPDPQTTLNIAKKFDALIRKALGKAANESTVTVGRLRRDQEINKLVFFMVFTIKVPRKVATEGSTDSFLDDLLSLKVSKRNPIRIGKYNCWFERADVKASGTLFTVDCIIQYTESKPAVKPPFIKMKNNVADTKAKAPKGTGKLKAFLKENGIDLKTLKLMIKHL